jgi:3-hydroxypropanoate dehydrogenase
VAKPLDNPALDQLFREARTRNGWVNETITPQQIQEIYDLAKMGPTSANISPARFVWVTSPEAKAQLAGLALPSNGEKIKAAPTTVIIGYDLDFPEHIRSRTIRGPRTGFRTRPSARLRPSETHRFRAPI